MFFLPQNKGQMIEGAQILRPLSYVCSLWYWALKSWLLFFWQEWIFMQCNTNLNQHNSRTLPTEQNQQTETTLSHLHKWKNVFSFGFKKAIRAWFFAIKVESGSKYLKHGCLTPFRSYCCPGLNTEQNKRYIADCKLRQKKKDELTMDFHLRFIIIY